MVKEEWPFKLLSVADGGFQTVRSLEVEKEPDDYARPEHIAPRAVKLRRAGKTSRLACPALARVVDAP